MLDCFFKEPYKPIWFFFVKYNNFYNFCMNKLFGVNISITKIP